MITCPTCGSNRYAVVAPGVAECAQVHMVPTGAHPSGVQGPPTLPRVCGHRFQIPLPDGTLGMCSLHCGLQAIGQCTVCGSSLCLQHSCSLDGRVVCPTHHREELALRKEAAEQTLADLLEEINAVLREANRPPAAPPDRLNKHFLGGGQFDRPAGVQQQAAAGAKRPGPKAGDPCPVHDGHACTITSVTMKGMLRPKVQRAECEMPLWQVYGPEARTLLCIDASRRPVFAYTRTMDAYSGFGVDIIASVDAGVLNRLTGPSRSPVPTAQSVISRLRVLLD